LPDAVVVEPTCGAGACGRGGGVLVLDELHAPSSRAAVASARRDERIGAILRRSDGSGILVKRHGRTVTS
jgi:hypothetical protein